MDKTSLKLRYNNSNSIEAAIEESFVEHNRIVGEAVHSFYPWLKKGKSLLLEGKIKESIDVFYAVLDEIGYREQEGSYLASMDATCSRTDDNCLTCAYYLSMLYNLADESLKDDIHHKLQFLSNYNFFKPHTPFLLDQMIDNNCQYPFEKGWRPIL